MEYTDTLPSLANITRKKCLFIHARFLRIIIYSPITAPIKTSGESGSEICRGCVRVDGWLGSHEIINPVELEYSEDVVVSSTIISSWYYIVECRIAMSDLKTVFSIELVIS